MKYLGWLLGIGILLSSSAANAASLAGSEWGIKGNKQFFINFGSEEKLHGNAGCNSFFGQYRIKDDKISFRKIATTRMLCPPEQMKIENEFLRLLEDEMHWKRRKHVLDFHRQDGVLLQSFQQRDWD